MAAIRTREGAPKELPAHSPEVERRTNVAGVVLVLSVTAVVASAWLGPFLVDPRRLAPGPDMAWYTWRAEVLTAHPPSEVIRADGPLEVFGGGYRVATPLLGALIRQIADVDKETLSTLLVAGRQVLLALALAAVAYRLRRDPLIFVSVALVSGAALYLRPFVGYVDNLIALGLAAGVLWFLPEAGMGWPARVAIFLFTYLMLFTHPTTAGIFLAALAGSVALGAAMKRSARGLRSETWGLATALCGAVAGYMSWLFGLWGPGRTFRDAMHIPPYPSEDFLDATLEQVRGSEVLLFIPLVLLGLVALVLGRREFSVGPLTRAIILWLLPLAGMLGFYAGFRYPYKRFLNSTLSPLILGGIGLWAAVRFFGRFMERGFAARRWRKPAMGLAGLLVTGVLVVSAGASGARSFERQNPWAPRNLRVGLAAVRSYLDHDRVQRPLIFVISVGPKQDNSLVWGGIWRGNWSQVRAGLPGRVIPQTYIYLGSVREFVAGRPTQTGNRLVDLISRAAHREIAERVGGREPLVLLVKRFNRRLGNDRYLGHPRSVPLGGGVFVLKGKGFAEPDPSALGAARRTAADRTEYLSGPVDRWGRPWHLLRVAAGLLFLLLVPGLFAARWFRLGDVASMAGMVPLLSLAMNVASGLLLLAVFRMPLSPPLAWAATGLATAVGAFLFVFSRGTPHPAVLPPPEENSGSGESTDRRA